MSDPDNKCSGRSHPVHVQGVAVPTSDNFRIVGSLLTPIAGATTRQNEEKIAVVLHPATGVNAHLYRKFAEYLASVHGWPTLIYDFRGSGLSAFNTDASNEDILMTDWMLYDLPAANEWMRKQFPEHKLAAICHSVGAHGQVAVQGRESKADTIVSIASHAGITKTVQGTLERLKVWNFFNVIVPLGKKLLGYVPTETVGFGKQIPIGVLTQWAKWTHNSQYFFDDPDYDLRKRFGEATGPILSVVLSDDPWAHRGAVDILTDKMTNADVEKLNIQVGKDVRGPVGHMGFYRSKNRELWPGIVDWVRRSL